MIAIHRVTALTLFVSVKNVTHFQCIPLNGEDNHWPLCGNVGEASSETAVYFGAIEYVIEGNTRTQPTTGLAGPTIVGCISRPPVYTIASIPNIWEKHTHTLCPARITCFDMPRVS